MNYTHIFWDFNGTLLDDVDTGIKSANTLLSRRNIPIIPSRDAYHKVFGFPIIDYYRRLGFDFEKESYDDLAVEWVELYNQNVLTAALYEGITDILTRCKERGIKQIVLSATELQMLKRQLDYLEILPLFDDVLGLDTIHAYSKTQLGIDYVQKLRPSRAVLIGDTEHDYDTACAMGIDCILVANGHASFDSLSKLPCPVYRDVRDIEFLG